MARKRKQTQITEGDLVQIAYDVEETTGAKLGWNIGFMGFDLHEEPSRELNRELIKAINDLIASKGAQDGTPQY